MMHGFFEMAQDDADLLALIKRIKIAADKAARRGEELDEYVILRKPPFEPGRPLVQFINGDIPKGFNFFDASPATVRKHQATTRKRKKLNRKLNKRPPVLPRSPDTRLQ